MYRELNSDYKVLNHCNGISFKAYQNPQYIFYWNSACKASLYNEKPGSCCLYTMESMD